VTRERFYSTTVPIWAILYVIVLLATRHNGAFAAAGAVVFALIAVVGATLIRPGPTDGRSRERQRRRR